MNYRETTSNTSWRRCSTVHIYNPLQGTKTCRFDEEAVVQLRERFVCAPEGYITKNFEPGAAIALLDPQSGEPTGESMTHEQLYQVLFSLYLQTATERDAAQAAQP